MVANCLRFFINANQNAMNSKTERVGQASRLPPAASRSSDDRCWLTEMFATSRGLKPAMGKRDAYPTLRFVLLALYFVRCFAVAGEAQPAPQRHPAERNKEAALIHRADILRDRGTNNSAAIRVWPVHATTKARMNY